MIYLNNTYEVTTGGFHIGNTSWNNERSNIDNCFKLYFLKEGEIYIYDNDQTFTLQANNFYFINGYELKGYRCNNQFMVNWLHFAPVDFIIQQGLQSLPTVVQLSEKTNDFIDCTELLEKLLSSDVDYTWKYSVEILKFQTLIQTITLELLSKHNIDLSNHSADLMKIEPALVYMKQNFNETIKLEDLANKCHMSSSYFFKIFKKILDTTPFDYIVSLRMNNARILLTDKQNSIKNIAYQLGFTDVAHFCKSFKKYYNVPPGEYQKNWRNFSI